jgi:excinuclease ABC subunit C
MPELFADGRFADFGSSSYLPAGAACRCVRVEGCKPSALRSQVKLLAPPRAGIYGMLDANEQLLYVGKAKNLRIRLLSYFRRKGRPAKAGRMVALARRVVWEVVPSEFASLLRELELIRRWRPRFNVQGQPLRRRLTFLCVGRAPAPYLYLSRQIAASVQAAFGPITDGARAQEAVRRLNDCFRLRDCPQPLEMIFPDQPELFDAVRDPGCMRMDLGTCLGPCTGTCSRQDYQRSVRQACDFLAGRDPTLLQKMQSEMQTAATAQQFERAAALRDRLATLQWLSDRLERIRTAQREMSFVYPVAGHDGNCLWYLIHGARAIAALPAPTDAAAWKSAREQIDCVYQSGAGLLDSYEHADSMMVVMQWFRRHPAERKRCISPDVALKARCELPG